MLARLMAAVLLCEYAPRQYIAKPPSAFDSICPRDRHAILLDSVGLQDAVRWRPSLLEATSS